MSTASHLGETWLYWVGRLKNTRRVLLFNTRTKKTNVRTLQFNVHHGGYGLSWRSNVERDIMFGAWMVVNWGTDYCVERHRVRGVDWNNSRYLVIFNVVVTINEWFSVGKVKYVWQTCLASIPNSEKWYPRRLPLLSSWPTFTAYPKIFLNHPVLGGGAARSGRKVCDIGAISEPIKSTPCATFWSFPPGFPFFFDTTFVCSDLLIGFQSNFLKVDSFGGRCDTRKSQDLSISAALVTTEDHSISTCIVTSSG